MVRTWQVGAVHRFESIGRLIYSLKLHECIVALDLHALQPTKGLKVLLQVTLACPIRIKIDHKESGRRLHLPPSQILTAPHFPIHLTSTRSVGSQTCNV